MKKKEITDLLFGPSKDLQKNIAKWTRQEQVTARKAETVSKKVYHTILGSAESGAEYHLRIYAENKTTARETARELCVWMSKGGYRKLGETVYPIDMPMHLAPDARMIDQWVRFFPQNITVLNITLEKELVGK